MKVLVTGSKGFLAGYILPVLQSGFTFVPTDIEELDVREPEKVLRFFEKARPEAVLHLAALCGAKPSVERPLEYFATNAQAAVNVFEACRKSGVANILFISSLTVFGSSLENVTEDSPFRPRHPYAASKVAAEMALRTYCDNYGLRGIIMRPTLVVGENFREPHAIGDFAGTILQKRPIEIYGDGSHRRDFIHPDDVVTATKVCLQHFAKMKKGQWDSFNFSSGEAYTMNELADIVVSVVGAGEVKKTPATSQSFSLFTRNDKAESVLGWKPRWQVRQITQRVADFLRAHPSPRA